MTSGQFKQMFMGLHRPMNRDLFESDFAIHALAEDNPMQSLPVREQFVGDTIDYELSRCAMFFVPVRRNDIWWSYAWDLKNSKIFIIDPLVGAENDESVIQMHYGTIELLGKYLSQSIIGLFNGWTPRFNACNTVVLRSTCMPCVRSQTGLITLFCIRNFDGTQLTIEPSKINLHRFKEYLLYEILALKQNNARAPSNFVHAID